MNRRDLTRFVELKKVLEDEEREDDFSFFRDDVTEDLNYKFRLQNAKHLYKWSAIQIRMEARFLVKQIINVV